MIILFYSNECKFCLKLLDYIYKNNLKDFLKMINIDEIKDIPENITIVPTIINSQLEVTLEGKNAFEFVINQKFFNHPTNNIDSNILFNNLFNEYYIRNYYYNIIKNVTFTKNIVKYNNNNTFINIPTFVGYINPFIIKYIN